MKLSQSTIAILKNFANINNTIVIDEGSLISTMTVDKTIIAVANIDDEFTQQFGIYDLPRFLSIMSIFKEPDIQFSSTKQAKIVEGTKVVHYTFAEPSILTKAPKSIRELDTIASFEMSSELLSSLQKATSVIGLDRIRVRGNGEKLFVGAFDSQNATSDSYIVEVGETDKEFDIHIKVEYLKVIPGVYNVVVNERAAKFTSTELDLKYWLSIEKTSKF